MKNICPTCLKAPSHPKQPCLDCLALLDGIDLEAKVQAEAEHAQAVGEIVEAVFEDLVQRPQFDENKIDSFDVYQAWKALTRATHRQTTPEQVIIEFLLSLVTMPFMEPWYSIGIAERKWMVKTWTGQIRKRLNGGSTSSNPKHPDTESEVIAFPGSITSDAPPTLPEGSDNTTEAYPEDLDIPQSTDPGSHDPASDLTKTDETPSEQNTP